MPIYEYVCGKCGEEFEHRTTIADRNAKTPCPSCGSRKTDRKLSAFAVRDGTSSAGAAPARKAHGPSCGCCHARNSCPMQS